MSLPKVAWSNFSSNHNLEKASRLEGLSETSSTSEKESILNFGILEKCSNVVTGFLEAIFYRIGLFIGTRPWAGILIGLAIFLLPMIGMVRFYEETDAAKLWVPQGSRAAVENRQSKIWFPGNSRIAQAIIVAENVMDAVILEQALTLDERIKKMTVSKDGELKNYGDLCYKGGPFCLGTSLLELWSYNRTIIEGLTNDKIVNEVNTAAESSVTKAAIDVSLLIGGSSDSDNDGTIDNAKALSLTYFINTERTLNTAEREVMEWESNFLDVCSDAMIIGGKVYYFAVRSHDDVRADAMFHDLSYLAFGCILIVLYLIVSLGKFNCRDQKIYMALCGILCIGMSLGISYGLSSAIGVFYSPLNMVMPFLLLGIGVDDMFVFVAAWDNLSEKDRLWSLSEKIGLTTKYAGVSILVTSLTDFATFAIGATTIIPGLRSFCIYAAMGILGIFHMTLFLFTGLFAYDQKRTAANRNACLCCIKLGDDYQPNQCSENPVSVKIFDKLVARALTYLPVKVLVVIITMGLLCVGVWGTIEIKQDYQEKWFIPKGNYLYDYILISEHYFPENGYDAYVYIGNIDYYNLKSELLLMKEKLGRVDKVSSGSIDFWMSTFFKWTNSNATKSNYQDFITDGEPNNSSSFDYLVRVFINETQEGSLYMSDVIFDTTGKVHRSRMFLRFVRTETSTEGIAAMDQCRSVVDNPPKWSETEVFMFGEVMLTWEVDRVIRTELYRNVGLAFVVVFLVCMLLIANFVTVMLVVSCVVLTLVNVIGFLHLWGSTINVATTMMVIMAIGLTVDYAAHVGHTFMVSTGNKQDRMRATLSRIGTAVFNGGFSTFLAASPLVFSIMFETQMFFQVFTLTSAFGLFHGLLFLPVMLSWVGPPPYQYVTAIHTEIDKKWEKGAEPKLKIPTEQIDILSQLRRASTPRITRRV